MEAATASSHTVAGGLLNPTALRFEMEGTLHLKFSFVSYTSAKALARQRRYHRLHNTAVVAFLVASIGPFLLWFPLFFDARWASWMCVTVLLVTAIAVPIGLTSVVMGYFSQQWLQNKAQTYRDASGLNNEFSAWTRDHAG